MSTDPMEEIRASFFVECDELMESLQDALMVLEGGEGDDETINVVFRAVHSIKGGAGAFGFDALVAFAHRFETVLDELRAGRLELTPDATKMFFQGADLLHDYITAAQGGEPPPAEGERVLRQLEALLGDHAPREEEVTDFTPMGLSFDFDIGSAGGEPDVGGPMAEPAPASSGPGDWLVQFAPHPGLFTSGSEPLLILRALRALGATDVTCHAGDPVLDPAEAEIPTMSWDVRLPAHIAEAEIAELFDFVNDVCDLTIQRAPGADETALLAGGGDVEQPEGPALQLPRSSIVAGANDDGPFDRPADRDLPTPPGEPSAELTPVPAAGTGKSRSRAEAEGGAAGATVRVDLDRVDRLVNLVGELVINQAMLAQSVAEAGMGEHTAVMNGLEEFMMLTRDIQDSVMMIRAQPVKPLFQRMARIVRESSAAIGKEVRLRTEGEATEVDKTVIERLADPLTHMIRNAIDHGIETPEQRRAAGKPSEGNITLSATHRAGRILIEIADDGAGINRPRVREIAVNRGLIAEDAILTDAEIDNLLFLPGFSTASQVSALSGRGVGMDVVKSAITALGGRIVIVSEPGQGTRFSISLPLTLAVLDGMVVHVADQTLVVPLSAIVDTATLTPQDVRQIGRSTEVLHIRGELVPLFDLGVQLGFRPRDGRRDSGIVILTTQDDGTRAALIVDAIMEQRQVVIKGLSRNYGHLHGVAAATILGDGQVALILDPADLTNPPPTAAPDAADPEYSLAG